MEAPFKTMFAKEAAEFLGWGSAGAIRQAALRGRIPYRRVAGRLVFIESELKAWIEGAPGIRLSDLERGAQA